MDFYDEVDVIAIWELKKNVASAKWLERKEALEALTELIEKNPRLARDSTTIYGEVMDQLRTILKADSNAMVVSAAMTTIAKLADGLGEHFGCFVSMLLPHVLEKAKDKKQMANVGKVLDAISGTCQPDRLTKDVVEHLGKPSPLSKACIANFVYRFLTRQSRPPMEFLKNTVPLLVKLSLDGDKNVREAALQGIGSAKRLLGGGISAYLAPINSDKAKMDRIEEALKKATDDWKAEMEAKGEVVAVHGTAQENGEAAVDEENGGTPADGAEIDPWTLKDEVDVAANQPENWATLVASTKWAERKEAAEWVVKAMEHEPRVAASEKTAEMIATLITVLKKDLNVNVAAFTAKALTLFAKGMRTDFAGYANKIIPICFDRLKEKKPVLRDELVALADVSALTTKLANVVEGVMGAMDNKNPQIRSQTCQFLRRLLEKHDKRTLPVGDVKQLIPSIQKCCSDGDGEVREGALKIVTILMKTLGKTIIGGLFPEISGDKVKMDKIEGYLKEYENAPPLVTDPQLKKLYEGEAVQQLGSAAPAQKSFTAKPAPRSTPKATPVKTAPAKPVQPRRSVAPMPRPSVVASAPRVAAPVASAPRVAPVATRPVPRRQPVAVPTAATPRPTTAPAAARVPIWQRSNPTVSAPRPASAASRLVPQRPAAVPSRTAAAPLSRPSRRPVAAVPARPVGSTPARTISAPRVSTAPVARPVAPLSTRFGFSNGVNRPTAPPAKESSAPRPRLSGIPAPGSRSSSRPPSRASSRPSSPPSAMGSESNV